MSSANYDTNHTIQLTSLALIIGISQAATQLRVVESEFELQEGAIVAIDIPKLCKREFVKDQRVEINGRWAVYSPCNNDDDLKDIRFRPGAIRLKLTYSDVNLGIETQETLKYKQMSHDLESIVEYKSRQRISDKYLYLEPEYLFYPTYKRGDMVQITKTPRKVPKEQKKGSKGTKSKPDFAGFVLFEYKHSITVRVLQTFDAEDKYVTLQVDKKNVKIIKDSKAAIQCAEYYADPYEKKEVEAAIEYPHLAFC